MERENKEKILEIIKAIEDKNSEMKDFVSKLSILSRNDMLKDITRDIINNNSFIQALLETKDQIISREKKEKLSIDYTIDGYINKIQKNPHKKIIYLREYLELFRDLISEKDKDVILNSLKDERNEEELKKRMLFLANTFELKL